MEEVKNEIDALIQQKEKEIKIWQDMLNEIKFEGLTVMYKIMYELHISQTKDIIEILKILKEK
jgi:hypothetical protein